MKDMNNEVTDFDKKQKEDAYWFVGYKAVCIISTTQAILLQRTFLLAMGSWEELLARKHLQFQLSSPLFSLFWSYLKPLGSDLCSDITLTKDVPALSTLTMFFQVFINQSEFCPICLQT